MRFKPQTVNAFGLDPWILREEGFTKEGIWHRESILSQGNGALGMRGSYDEPLDDNAWTGIYACFLNGSYEYDDIQYGWRRYGLAERSQGILRVPDWHLVKLSVDGDVFTLLQGRVLSSRRELDMRDGVMTREVEWESPNGRVVRLRVERLLSMPRAHCATLRYTATAVSGDMALGIESGLDGRVENIFARKQYTAIDEAACEGGAHWLRLSTPRSKLTIGLAFQARCDRFPLRSEVLPHGPTSRALGALRQGESVVFEKYVAIVLERSTPEGLRERVTALNRDDASAGFEALRAEHRAWWQKFWDAADIAIDGDPAIQQGVRYTLFQLAQNSGRDGLTNVGAKGLTGYLYNGKTFWDTEVYMVPFFVNADPAWAKALIEFRYNTLNKAREYAQALGFKGALFPWETINGEESAFIYEASTAQYHVNAAVGYAIKRYWEVTHDWAYTLDHGLEILIETARMYFSLGAFTPTRGGQFCLCEVCGPDEYSPMVDNNCYTNVMVKHHFEFTVRMAAEATQRDPAAWEALRSRLGLDPAELEGFGRAAAVMYVPYHDGEKIHLQDDQFYHRPSVGDLETWKATSGYKGGKIHPLNLFRAQVVKQADVILLMVLRGLDYDTEQKRRNYEYYEPKTLHSSSLSPCMYSITASEIGRADHALPYLFYTVRLDLDNYGGAEMGLHAASLGGAWRGIVQGLGGVCFHDERIDISPRLPAAWKGLSFKVRFAGSVARLEIQDGSAQLTLLEGEGFAFTSHGTDGRLSRSCPTATLQASRIGAGV